MQLQKTIIKPIFEIPTQIEYAEIKVKEALPLDKSILHWLFQKSSLLFMESSRCYLGVLHNFAIYYKTPNFNLDFLRNFY